MNEKLLQNLQHLLNLFKLLESWKPHFWYTKRNHKTMTNERRKNNQLDEQMSVVITLAFPFVEFMDLDTGKVITKLA